MSRRRPPDEPEPVGGSVLGPDGRIEHPSAAPSPSPDDAPPLTLAEREEPLELDERPRSPQQAPIDFGTPAPRPRRGRGWVLAWVLLAATLALVALTRGRRFTADGEPPVVLIDSEPSGAEVRISGQLLGNTPLVFQNRYPEHPIPVEIRSRGYRPWNGSFRGGQEVKLEIKLAPAAR